jgi:hypothetical protein
MVFNKDIHQLQNRIFDAVLYVTYILYIAVALGLSANAPEYLDELQRYIKLYVSLFLIYRFNPFRRVQFTGLDAKIAFNAGWFLLTTTFVDSMLKKYLETIKKYLKLLNVNAER